MRHQLTIAGTLAAAALSACSSNHPITETKEAISSESVKKAAPSQAADLGSAFVATFGSPAPYTSPSILDSTGDTPVAIEPEALFELSPGLWVLISDGIVKDGSHVSYGRLIVSYLTRENGSFKAVGRWTDVGGGAAFGQVAPWKIRYDLEPNPVIWTTSEDGGQGCDVTGHDIISLLPNKAQLTAENILTDASYDGSADGKPWKLSGQLVPSPGQHAFSVRYTGKVNRTVNYSFAIDGYIATNGEVAPQSVC